ISELDALIFGPGGYFGEPSGGWLKKLRWSFRNYKRHIIWNSQIYSNKIPYAIIGVGVGPLSFGFIRSKVIKLFHNTSYISVRDKYSQGFIVNWGSSKEKINQTSDVALSLVPDSSLVPDKNKVALHFSTSKWKSKDQIESFVSFIKEIKKDYRIYLFEDAKGQFSNPKNPNNLKNILHKWGINLPIVEYKDPNTVIENLKSFDTIITSKLHVGIVGYSLGKKVLSIPSHQKTSRFYEQINR